MEPGAHSSSAAAIKSKELRLEPETEYRFELDPGTTLAIKARYSFSLYTRPFASWILESFITTRSGEVNYNPKTPTHHVSYWCLCSYLYLSLSFLAYQRNSGDIWCWTCRRKDILVRGRMQSCSLYVAWLYHTDEPDFTACFRRSYSR